MRVACEVMGLCRDMAETGNPNSVSDAGVGALAVRAAVRGACLNVKINAASLKDRSIARQLLDEAEDLAQRADRAEREIMQIVESKIEQL